MNSILIKAMYREYKIPCDTLVSNPDTLVNFTHDYNSRTGHEIKPAEMGKKLLNLRRKGEHNGGLPRLIRNYYGRNINN